MNALETKIHQLIEAEGPISVSTFMALCLGDPDYGYYIKQEAFGAAGDFITAPEVSQLFGEMVGVYLALCLDAFEPGQAVTLVELGPGRGVLMVDVLRTLKQLRPVAFSQLSIAMVESSPRLRDMQLARVSPYKMPEFHATIDTIFDQTPLLVIANEFLDALPFHQYEKRGQFWHERVVTIESGKLAFTLGPATLTPNELPANADNQKDGTIFEISPARASIVDMLATKIKTQSGTALFVDYGHLKSGFGDTLQAVRGHQFVDVFEAPGEVDLTSHVDFAPLEAVALAKGCKTGMATQAEFLLQSGLLERAGVLGTNKPLDLQNQIQDAVERLAGPDQMGSLFKVLSFGTTLPPPFGEAYNAMPVLPK